VERWQKAWTRQETSYLLYGLLILTSYDDSKGKLLNSIGERYEGDWKDNKKNGQGKKEGFTLSFFI